VATGKAEVDMPALNLIETEVLLKRLLTDLGATP
jgi:hypothetical protein